MQQTHTEPNYMGVFYWLAALTILEVGVTFLPITKFGQAVLLVVLAFTKAALVALYFMHLKFERRTMLVVATTPVILCVFLMFMLLPDRVLLSNRPATPSVPTATTR